MIFSRNYQFHIDTRTKFQYKWAHYISIRSNERLIFIMQTIVVYGNFDALDATERRELKGNNQFWAINYIIRDDERK